MRKDCDTCLHDEFGETYCNDCYWANGKPPTKWEPAPFWTPDTNADRIRAMSDEELAAFLDTWGCCHHWIEHERLSDNRWFSDEKCDEKCVEHCLEWLKQPADMRGEVDA